MNARFDPKSPVIQLCMGGMRMEESGEVDEAIALFQKAWHEAADDYERFIAAYHLALRQESVKDKLRWMETSLECALNIDDDNVRSAYSTLYSHIAQCYEELGDLKSAEENYALSNSHKGTPTDKGPFYHGTKADLQAGDLLTPGGDSNYKPGLKMNHVYFTANLNGAGLAAALAKGDGKERVYVVEPTGEFEDDPNVTDKKFPGNLTRSYRSQAPLRIIDEVTEWAKLTDTDRREWHEKLAKNKGEIIN